MDENYIINYISDIKDVANKAKQIERINAKLSKQLGVDFTNSINIIRDRLNGVQFNKEFKIKADDGSVKTVVGNVQKFTTKFETANGALFKFNETIRTVNGESKILNSNIQAVNKPADDLIGKSSRLSTNFNSLADINQKFSKELKGFSSVVRVFSSDLVKASGNTKQIVSVIQTANGEFLKLTETIKRTDNGIQTVSNTVSTTKSPFKELNGQSSQLSTNFNNLNNVNNAFKNNLKEVGNVSKFLGTTLSQTTDQGSRTTKIFETVNGKFVALTETVKRTPKGIQEVARTTKEMNKAQLANITTLEKGKLSTRTFADNLKTLLKRAALTIPVWFALRQSVASVFRTIRDGLKDIVDFDRALQKLKRNISATSTDIDGDFSKVQDVIKQFSIESGQSVEDITNAIQKFATVGFDLESSLTGGIQSTKLAVTLFGDATETANAFARSLRVMTEDVKDAGERQKIISEALALTDQLWKTNAFEVNEFSGNLEKFAGTAKIANLSINDTLSLLATLSTGGLSNRAGRLLRSTLLKSLADIDKVSQGLNLNFDPRNQTSIEFILELVGALKNLKTEANVPAELSEILGELFTVRGTEVLAALTALEGTLKENIALRPDLQKFNKDFQDQEREINRLVDQYKNLNKEIGRAFTNGIVGGEDFKGTLEDIIKIQKIFLTNSEKIGSGLVTAFKVAGVASVIAFNAQITSAIKKLGILLNNPLVAGSIAAFTVINFKEEAKRLEKEAKNNNKEFTDIGRNIAENINKGFRGQLSSKEIDNLIGSIEAIGAEGLKFDQKTIDRALEQLEIQKLIAQEKEKQVEITKEQEKREQNVSKANENILNHILAEAQARGLSLTNQLKLEQAVRKQLDFELQGTNLLDKRLQLQRAINDEQRLSADLSSDAVKLFRIAQTEGTGIAKAIGDVLSGQISFNSFVRRGGRELEVFKSQFNDIFENQQARQFFSGSRVAGLENLRGGSRIELSRQDQAIIDPSSVSSELKRLIPIVQAQADNILNGTDNNTRAVQENTQALEKIANLINNQPANLTSAGNQTPRTQFLGQDLASRSINGLPVNRVTSAGVAPSPTQRIEFTLNIDGKELPFAGTADQVRELARRITSDPQVLQTFEDKIADSLANPNSKIGKQDRNNINNF